jgi:hypothetical protein
MTEFKNVWAVIINMFTLSKDLGVLLKNGNELGHMKRLRMNTSGDKPLRTFSMGNLFKILTQNITPLGYKQHKSIIKERWGEAIKFQHVVVFDGLEWVARWKELMMSNAKDVKRWYNDLSTWEHEELNISEQEKRGWLACSKHIPHGLYDLSEDEGDDASSDANFAIDFGWHVLFTKE